MLIMQVILTKGGHKQVMCSQSCIIVSWKASLQHMVVLSTTESKYIALTEAIKEVVWLRGIADKFGMKVWLCACVLW